MKSYGDDLPSATEAKKRHGILVVLMCINLVVCIANLAMAFCPKFS